MRTSLASRFVLLACVASAISLSATARAEEPASITAAPHSLVALPASSDDLLFAGERARHTVVMVAQPEQLAGPASLFLTLQSAVSVAPEWSQLTVQVNNQELGGGRLVAGEPYSMEFPLPQGVLQPGYNAVTFTVNQAHRVDCSPEATYELWTRIDPLQSGFAFQGGAVTTDFLSVLGAVRSSEGTTPLHGITSTVKAEGTSRLLTVFQTLAAGADIDRPAVTFGGEIGEGQGIDVIVGTRSDLVGRTNNLRLPMPIADGLSIGQRADGRVVIVLAAGTDEEFTSALNMLREGLAQSKTGTAAGLAALDSLKGRELPASGKLSFADLDVDTGDFGGRLFDQTVRFRLPADFYPADYAQAQINLDALYASGLAPGAALQFKVNDQIVSTLKLSGSRVGEARARRLPVPLSAFRPGLNEMKIEAQLPAHIDAACAPGTTAYNGRRLQLAGSSELELPAIGRIGRFPDLGALGLSMVGRDAAKTLNLVVPSGGEEELAAAATLVSRLAYATGQVIDVSLTNSASIDPTVPTLMVGAISDLPSEIAARLPIDLRAAPMAAAAQPGPETLPASTSRLPSFDMLSAEARQVVDDVEATLYGLGLSVGLNVEALRSEAAPTPAHAGTDLVLAQTVNASASAPITILTASSTQQIAETMPKLVQASSWSHLQGSAVSLAGTGELLQTIPTRHVQYFPSGENSLTNARLVAAGWLSNTPGVYVILLVISALFLGLFTHLLLVRTRARSRQ